MAECWVINYTNSPTLKKGIVKRGCRIPTFAKYIVSTPEGFKLLGNKEEFTEFFAPISTPEEAISFLVSITGDMTKYKINLTKDKFTEVYATDVRPTYAEKTKEGIRVRLFKKELCGCEHPLFAIEYLVTKDGVVTELDKQKMLTVRGPCVD